LLAELDWLERRQLPVDFLEPTYGGSHQEDEKRHYLSIRADVGASAVMVKIRRSLQRILAATGCLHRSGIRLNPL
jgi:hypothetical protein